MRSRLCRISSAVLLTVVAALHARPATALPAFAQQTGQPCTFCHIGAFGPQLTPAGRAFKIGGYTQTGGQGIVARIPLAAFFLGSFTHTQAPQPQPPAADFKRNNNFAPDQVSVFLAGRATDFAGAFVQGTYSGIDKSFKLDNTDLRVTNLFTAGGADLRIGLSANNGPTVQDPYNSTFVWIFPFAQSALAPVPTAQPLLAGGLIGNSIGLTAYAWYDSRLYAEAGGNRTYGPSLLSATGTVYGPGSTAGIAPYVRVAYEWNWNRQSAHLGGLFLGSNFNPAIAPRSVNGSQGRDRFADFGVDGGYQFLGDGTNVATVDAIYVHEWQNLQGSFNLGTASQAHNRLNQIRANTSYFRNNTYGVTLGWQYTWGNANPLLFPAQPVSGSANGKPNSNAFIVEADWIPFGKSGSWWAPFANLKIGVQYIVYTLFNGGTKNYDNFGRNAGDNNTLFIYAWTAF